MVTRDGKGDQDEDVDAELLTTGQVAAMADTSRQAVLHAAKTGKLPVAKKGPHGENEYERGKALDWAKTVKRHAGHRPRGAAARPRPHPVPSPPVATSQAAAPRSTGRSTIADDPIPPPVMEALLEKVTTPKVLEQYEALLLDDAANRRRAAEVTRDRVNLDRLKVQVERRHVERELLKEERPNNVRQILERIRRWLSTGAAKSGDDPDTIVRFAQRVLDALGDDLVAEIARGGTFLEEAYLRTRASWGKWMKTSGLQPTDGKAHDEFVRIWIVEMTRKAEPSSATPPPAPAAKPPPDAGVGNAS